jgi:hypothetical protein
MYSTQTFSNSLPENPNQQIKTEPKITEDDLNEELTLLKLSIFSFLSSIFLIASSDFSSSSDFFFFSSFFFVNFCCYCDTVFIFSLLLLSN